jgi:hypothetical protein
MSNGSTQPMIIVFSDGMIFSSAEKRLLAKASLALGQGFNHIRRKLLFLVRVRWLWCDLHN